MKKLYCKNCKWFKEMDEDPLGIAGGSRLHFYCKILNTEITSYNKTMGNCPHYQRKWWMFWVK